jgi:hypothetical protein
MTTDEVVLPRLPRFWFSAAMFRPGAESSVDPNVIGNFFSFDGFRVGDEGPAFAFGFYDEVWFDAGYQPDDREKPVKVLLDRKVVKDGLEFHFPDSPEADQFCIAVPDRFLTGAADAKSVEAETLRTYLGPTLTQRIAEARNQKRDEQYPDLVQITVSTVPKGEYGLLDLAPAESRDIILAVNPLRWQAELVEPQIARNRDRLGL